MLYNEVQIEDLELLLYLKEILHHRFFQIFHTKSSKQNVCERRWRLHSNGFKRVSDIFKS